MKKKKVSKLGKLLIVGLVIILIILINPIKQVNKVRLQLMGYEGVSASSILKAKLESKVFDIKYNKTIDKSITDKEFDKNNYKIYTELDYHDYKNFVLNNNKLIDLKYTSADINLINKRGNDSDVSNFVTLKKIDLVSDYLKIEYSKLSNIKRYYDYKLDNGLSCLEAVIDVNIGLDKPFYQDAKLVEEFQLDMLVNKYNYVNELYAPKDLTKFGNNYSTDNEVYASKVTVDAFILMADAMAKEELFVLANSAYRSYEDQNSVYEDYKASYGEKAADNYAARAGFSEHQTGLCIDVASKSGGLFLNSKEYTYMKDNAYKYGFILRYPKGAEKLTGYKFESWHYRYVGVDLATKVFNSKLTFDEYYIMNMEK